MVRAQSELVAAEMVIADLRSRGHRVDMIERPDQINRSDRAADFLLDIDGRSVALEVTDFYPTEADGAGRGVGRWLAARLEGELRPQVEVHHQLHGSIVEPAVKSFLDRMVVSKAVQTARYDKVIVAAFDRSLVGDPESFQRLLSERADELALQLAGDLLRHAGSWRRLLARLAGLGATLLELTVRRPVAPHDRGRSSC